MGVMTLKLLSLPQHNMFLGQRFPTFFESQHPKVSKVSSGSTLK